MPVPPEGAHGFKVSAALSELAKGLKAVAFYPPGHPSLVQLLVRIVALVDDVPPPESGLEIGVTKNGLIVGDAPVPAPNKTLSDFNRDLYVRRVSKLILLPGIKPGELLVFLSALSRDPQTVQEQGGLEKILPREGVSRIWVNRVDYESMTELLKKEQAGANEVALPEDVRARSSESALFEAEGVAPDLSDVESVLAKLARETGPSAYRDHVLTLARLLQAERSDRKIEYTTRAFSLFARHVDQPPGQSAEIAQLAARGVKELGSDEMVGHYLHALRDRSRGDRQESEKILALFGERSVRPLLDALAAEEDLIVRKSIVEIITRIGRPAVPVILENLNDAQWYIVRNMVTILGNLGMPDLAPQVAGTLSHPDVRVKKEAIKALSRMDHPFAVSALGELCFHAEESVALTAIAALGVKKDAEAVLALYRRVARKNVFYPHFRLAHEAIDSLRSIGTAEALTALDEIVRMKSVLPSGRFREMRLHALRAIGKIGTDRAREILRDHLSDPEGHLRSEAKRLLRRFEP